MEGLDAFKDEGERNNEENRIFNELNGYTEFNDIDEDIRDSISENIIDIMKTKKDIIYEAEKPLMEKMINSDKVSNEAKEKLRKAFDSSKYYSEHKLPYETKIKRHLTKRKIEYIYNNIHNMLDDKITFKLDDNDIKKINIINSLFDATNKEYETEYKKESRKDLFKGFNIFSNKAQISSYIIELLCNKKVMNIGGPNSALCISQIVTDSTAPDKRLMVQGIPPKFINSGIEKLSNENISKEDREKAINDLRLSIIEYNMVKLPEHVKEFNMPNFAIEQIKKALDTHYGVGRKNKFKDNEVENK